MRIGKPPPAEQLMRRFFHTLIMLACDELGVCSKYTFFAAIPQDGINDIRSRVHRENAKEDGASEVYRRTKDTEAVGQGDG